VKIGEGKKGGPMVFGSSVSVCLLMEPIFNLGHQTLDLWGRGRGRGREVEGRERGRGMMMMIINGEGEENDEEKSRRGDNT
jgi:hypothetical protein